MDREALTELLKHQDGVVAWWQLVGLGAPHDVKRLLRRRELARLLRGVYVDHTGVPTWRQRAWAGVLACWPAALDLESALVAADPVDPPPVVHLAVDHSRRVAAPEGYRVRRIRHFEERTQSNATPPRIRLEQAALDVAAAAADDLGAVELLAKLCRDRRTTPARLAAQLASRSRHPRRAWLAAVLDDLAAGTCSVLERGYLDLVERPHGLPRGTRQRAVTSSDGRRQLRDVDYAPLPLVVELDGRVFHDGARQRARDLERDLDTAAAGGRTVRLGWAQVFEGSCATAARVGAVLEALGWPGSPRPCGPDCAAAGAAA